MTSENPAFAAAKERSTMGVLRNYFCPKCGAVGDVRWVRPVSQQEWDDAVAEDAAARAKYDAEFAEYRKDRKRLGWFRTFHSPIYHGWWGAAREGLEHGEHLACSCPRCSFFWRDSIITGTEDTPIFDALMASRG